MPAASPITRILFFRRNRNVCAAFAGFLALTTFLSAQDLVPRMASPVTEPAPVPTTPMVNPQGDRLPEAQRAMAAEVSSIPKRFQYAVRLGLRGAYDDNIYLQPTSRISDFYFAIEPGLTIGYGDIVGADQNFVRLDYAPSVILYLDHSNANATQQLLRLDAQYHLRRITLTLSEDIQFRDGTNFNDGSVTPNSVPSVNLDAGANTEITTFNTRLAFSGELTGKTFLTGGLQHSVNLYESSLIDSQVIQGNLYLNYTYSPKLVLGLGGTAGYNWVGSSSPDQSFEQINARLTYQLSGKVSLEASGGLEFRQSSTDHGDDGSHLSPVYEISASYQPFDGTTLSLSGNRRVENSAVFAGQDYSSTNISFNARQRFFQRLYLGFAIGYQNLSYFSTDNDTAASRDDDYFYFQPALDLTLTRYWTIGLYYLHRENETSATSFGFDDNQAGFRTSLTF